MLSWEEKFAIRVFEFLMTSYLSRPLGSFEERNGLDQSGLTVDGTYDEVDPPVALEITGLHREGEPELASAGVKLEAQLTQLAEDEALGDWLVVLQAGVRVREVLPELQERIREGKSIRTEQYGSAELLAMSGDELSAFLEVHRRLKALNIVDILKVADTPNRVRLMAFGSDPFIKGFSEALEGAIAANAVKLGQSRPRETHLAVLVHDAHASRFESETPPPALPAGIDYLWVIHMWPGADDRVPVWRLQRGESAWSVWVLPPEIFAPTSG